jgi:hypothetical protein
MLRLFQLLTRPDKVTLPPAAATLIFSASSSA